jgi:hypothetical protein
VTPRRVLSELEALAGRMGITVRAEAFGAGVLEGRGGLCWVDGKAMIVMDERLAVADRIAVLALALSRFDLDTVSVAPLVRDTIDGARTGARPKTRRAARPGLARTRPRK